MTAISRFVSKILGRPDYVAPITKTPQPNSDFRRSDDPPNIIRIETGKPKGARGLVGEDIAVAGISLAPRCDYAVAFMLGRDRRIELVRSPHPQDPDAIEVIGLWRANPGRPFRFQLGYLAAETAKDIARTYPAGPLFAVLTTMFQPVKGKSPGIRLDVWASDQAKPESTKRSKAGPALGTPVCPYCAHLLDRFPRRKRKCPKCQNTIVIWTDCGSRELVTDAHAQVLEVARATEKARQTSARRERTSRRKWLRELEQWGMSGEDFDRVRSSNSSDADALWALFNEALAALVKSRDLHDLKTIYYSMALFLDAEHRDPSKVARESRRMELLEYQQTKVVERVKIYGGECGPCRSLEGRSMTIEEALRTMPLPCEDCETPLANPNRGFCRCGYSAEFE